MQVFLWIATSVKLHQLEDTISKPKFGEYWFLFHKFKAYLNFRSVHMFHWLYHMRRTSRHTNYYPLLFFCFFYFQKEWKQMKLFKISALSVLEQQTKPKLLKQLFNKSNSIAH